MAANIDILIRALDQASGPIGNVQDSLSDLDDTAETSKKRFGGLSTAMGAGLKVAAGLGVGALVGLGAAITKGVGLAKIQIDAEKQLAAVLASTGEAAGLNAEEIKKMASELQQVTNFGDEAIISGQNLLLTFTNIGKDVFPQATETMLDMSQALGQDMKSSAIQLGKALNDPIQGITALSRVGVSFTDEQKELIETMVEAGDVAGAQGVILDELARQVGGSAQAMADPAVQLQNAWGDFMEEVGRAVIPILNNLARTVLPLVVRATESLVDGVQRMNATIGPIIQTIQNLFSNFGREGESVFAERFPRLFATMQSAFKRLSDAFGPLAQQISNVIAILSETIQSILAGLAVFWEAHGATIMRIVTNTFDTIVTIISTVISTVAGIITAFLQILQGDWQGAGQTLIGVVQNIWETIKTIFRNQIDSLMAIFGSIDWAELGRSIIQGIANGISNGVGSIIDAAQNAAQSALNAAMSWLGIGSPSKEAAMQVGVPFAQGIGAGIERELNSMASGLSGGFGSLLGGASAGLGGGGGPVSVVLTQNFSGGADAGSVSGASRDGILSGLRQAGFR